MTEYDTDYQPLITCPHCGHKDRNSWESELGDGDTEELECRSCDESFTVTARAVRTFTSFKNKGGGK